MSSSLIFKLALLAVSMSSVSCVIGHREISLAVPAGSHPAAKGSVSIHSVADARVFENKPSDPSTPSIDGDVKTTSAAELNRFVGRQRNGYGHAMGDVQLADNGTVTAKVQELVTEALARRGYQVGSGGTSVSVKVRRFWGWATPGMWYISIEAVVDCSVTAGGKTFDVEGKAKNNCQAATSGNWEQAYGEAFADFLSKLEAKLAGAGL